VLRNRVESCNTAEVYVCWISAYVLYIHSTPQPQVSRLIFTPYYCNTFTRQPIPNPLSQAPNKSTSQDGVVITSSGPDTQIPRYYLLVIDLIYIVNFETGFLKILSCKNLAPLCVLILAHSFAIFSKAWRKGHALIYLYK
jgi:hypothetical protein